MALQWPKLLSCRARLRWSGFWTMHCRLVKRCWWGCFRSDSWLYQLGVTDRRIGSTERHIGATQWSPYWSQSGEAFRAFRIRCCVCADCQVLKGCGLSFKKSLCISPWPCVTSLTMDAIQMTAPVGANGWIKPTNSPYGRTRLISSRNTCFRSVTSSNPLFARLICFFLRSTAFRPLSVS